MGDADFKWWDPFDEEGYDPRADAKRKAYFCMGTGVQPSEYENLTQLEINAFVEAARKKNKSG